MTVLILAASGGGSEFSHGDSVTVTGSGFGSHARDIYFLGGDGGIIEATTAGSTPSDTAVWTFDGVDQGVDAWSLPVGFNDATRGPVLRSAYSEFTFDLAVGWNYGAAIPANTRVYITEYTRLSPFTRTGGTVTQWKQIRFRSTFGVADDPTNGDAYLSNWINDFDNAFVDFQGSSGGGFESINGDGSTAFDGSSLPADGGQWHRIEWLINHGGNASAICDSDIRISREGSYAHRLVSTLQNFTFNRSIQHVIFQSYLGVGAFGGSVGSDSRVSHDDIYVQVGTFKRVELCDNATLTSATWREIQFPTAWSDTSVTVTLNTGAGRTGSLFLHVVGEDGSSLGSREITVT